MGWQGAEQGLGGGQNFFSAISPGQGGEVRTKKTKRPGVPKIKWGQPQHGGVTVPSQSISSRELKFEERGDIYILGKSQATSGLWGNEITFI